MPYFRAFFLASFLAAFVACNAPSRDSASSDVSTMASVDDPSIEPPSPDLTGTAALDSDELAFLETINEYRVENGLPELKISVPLTQASDWMSVDRATKDYFSHTDSLGRDFFSRIATFGASSGYSGENIAAGNSGAPATFAQWKNSPGHNANMLGESYRFIGIGRAPGGSYGWYWTTDFSSTDD